MLHRIPIAAAALLASLALLDCSALQRARDAFDPPPPAPPTQIRFDPYSDASDQSAFSSIAETKGGAATPEAAAGVALEDDELLEHLRMIDARYAGRRMPRLTWTALVRRLPPPGSRTARPSDPLYWGVELVSSKVRGSGAYYHCELRVSGAGVNLSIGKDPTTLCGWQEQQSQDFSRPRY